MDNKTKKWTILLLATVLAAGLTACGQTKADAPASSQNAASPTATSSPSASTDSVSETKQGTGEFVGLADPHTAEIKMAAESASFQLGEGTDEAVLGLKTGDPVSFEYVEKSLEGENAGTQLILTKIEKQVIANGKGGGTANADKPASELPKTKEFTLTLEGDKEQRTGTLNQGTGYAIYVFDGFTFDAASNKLTMNIDKNYYAVIEKLPSDYNMDQIKDDAEKDLAKLGDVRELKGSEISPLLGGAALMLLGSNDKLTQEVIVKEVGDAAYSIKVNMPQSEASEGFGPIAFTSLSSITNE